MRRGRSLALPVRGTVVKFISLSTFCFESDSGIISCSHWDIDCPSSVPKGEMMSYHPSKLRLRRFFHYITSVLGFSLTVNSIGDTRENPTVEMPTIFRAMFVGMLLRWGSIRRITKQSTRPQMRKFLRCAQQFCANTLAYGLAHIDIPSLD